MSRLREKQRKEDREKRAKEDRLYAFEERSENEERHKQEMAEASTPAEVLNARRRYLEEEARICEREIEEEKGRHHKEMKGISERRMKAVTQLERFR